MTTTKNILFMSGSYVEQFGEEFSRTSEITPEKVLQADLKIHAEKPSNELRRRRKSNAEVFTPAWLVNQMVNACDESWFGRKNVFNVELGKGWRENSGDIDFAGRNWQEYVKLTFLEITCGEAPFIASRYPSVGGHKAWFKLTSPSGTIAGRNTFISDLNKAVFGGGEWYPTPNGNAVRPGDKMNAAEPLIFDYHLDTWMNPAYRGTDVEKLCHPDLKPNYKGLLRYEQDGGQ